MPYYTANMVRYMRNQEKFGKTKTQGKHSVSPTASDCEEDYDEILSSFNVQSSYCSSVSKGQSGRFSTGGNSAAPMVVNFKVMPKKNKRKKKRALRVTPSCVDEDATKQTYQMNSSVKPKETDLSFDEKRLMYLKNLLRLQVERIGRVDGAISTFGKTSFPKYEIDFNESILNKSSKCVVYKTRHQDFPEIPMVAKIYENGAKNIANPIYLKILRHLGKKHPYIIQTWDIFIDERNRVYVFQEFANKGDLSEYLNQKGPPPENQICEWSRQIYKALDYLGDMGICHRNICPRYILLIHKELCIRLTGFYNSVIYWNVKKENILFFPCIPIAQKNREVADFQAPEVHGNAEKEEFDPISADIWSYGAIVFYMLTQNYPYNFKVDNPKIEEEIEDNIKKLPITAEGKKFLTNVLNTNAIERLTFDKIMNQPWFAKFRREYTLNPPKKFYNML